MVTPADDFLHSRKVSVRDHRYVFSFIIHTRPRIDEGAGVIRVSEKLIERLGREQCPLPCGDSPGMHQSEDLGLRVGPSSELLPRLFEKPKKRLVGHIRLDFLAAITVRAPVPQWSLPGEDSVH